MKTDDFEKKLQHQPQREIPSAWREEILNAAKPALRPSLLSALSRQLLDLLGSRRVAWASLAAVWIVILGLNLATRDDSAGDKIAHAAAPASPETMQALKQQRLLYAELVGRPELSPMNRTKINIPGPRSQRREETAVV